MFCTDPQNPCSLTRSQPLFYTGQFRQVFFPHCLLVSEPSFSRFVRQKSFKVMFSWVQTLSNTVSDHPHHFIFLRKHAFFKFLLVRKFVCGSFLSRVWGAVNFWTPPAAALHYFALDASVISFVRSGNVQDACGHVRNTSKNLWNSLGIFENVPNMYEHIVKMCENV